ncbi:1-acyl-sn-glycerol-3-phosphate acyltransferase [Methylotenera sp.]|uniref:lysophospholipid acyltransferase family protein n=1 Tax=Methylotenera sp. TaxID=2051956 RepID=UPI002721444E|nr:lysophospholipid acyltransferase family protein [Methylotenera sp.]MDO9205038.1 lysophospholipid acyltransferase family protein [Methylotenera sp.]MDO9393893.1 lysophospholipid acyltransferase family protein [Methylotenera sp.]MDP1523651.1 lysophospholipid acyltransferase family protein [Methylotenera sp.]MDP2071619.1 lysophospholipid acyltransferase family protein [Methylotenera sp.]MDP2229321.1 lysophospholipid acyltransferase family protein [Methylotenera sp.]
MKLLLMGYDYLVLYLGLLWLGLLTLGWTLVAVPLYPLLPARYAMHLGRYAIMTLFRTYIASLSVSRRCSFDLTELDALRNEAPLIIAPNHPSLLDAVMIISRLPNVACVMKSELMNNIFLGAGARLARYIRNEPVRQMVLQASEDFKTGSHLLLFPEGTRTTRQPINALKGSIALIAMQAQVPVQAVLIETNSPYLSKGWPLFRKPTMPVSYKIRLGKRFDPPENAHRFMEELECYFSEILKPTLQPVPAQGSLFPMPTQNVAILGFNPHGTPLL